MLPKNFNELDAQKTLFLAAIKKLHSDSRKIILRALRMAQHAHSGQLRDDGAPYVIHPIRVALSLIKEFDYTSPTLLGAALLHDVVEDCSISLLSIRRAYGERIASIIKNVTDTRPSFETEDEKKIRKHTKLKLIHTKTRSSRIIKCADLLDNTRSWPLLLNNIPSRKKIPRWLQEAHISYLPLAHATDMRMYQALKKAVIAFKKK